MDPMEESRLAVLRIPPPPTPRPAPLYALLPVTDPTHTTDTTHTAHTAENATTPRQPRLHAFSDLLSWGSTHLFVAQPTMLSALEQVEQIAASIATQPLWCLGEQSMEFKVGICVCICMCASVHV